jgi:tetratricopeptide (TPR) repeat protein
VVDSSMAGIHVQIKNENKENIMAFLPTGHMSPCYEVGKMLAAKTVAGDVLSAIVFSTYPYFILSSTFAPEKSYKIYDLNTGDNVLCSVSNIFKESIKLLVPVSTFSKYIIIPINEIENFECLYENQILLGKILKIDKETKMIDLTIKLNKIWENVTEQENKMMTAIDILSCYLNKVLELSKNIFYTSKSISKIHIGERINGTIESLTDYGLVLRLKENIKGIVRTGNYFGNYKQGDQIEGSVLWVNYPHEYVEITLLHSIINSIKIKQNNLAEIPIGVELRGEIILVTNWFVLVILKGQAKGTLVSLPVRRHLNDTIPDISPYEIGAKVRCYGVFNKIEAQLLLPICMLKSTFEIYKSEFQKPLNLLKLKPKMVTTVKNKDKAIIKKLQKCNSKDDIRKEMNKIMNEIPKENIENIKLSNQEKSVNTEISNEKKSNKRKIKEVKRMFYNIEYLKTNKTLIDINKNFVLNLRISECGFKWDYLLKKQIDDETSSDSDNEIEGSRKKLIKLSVSEKKELERQKERDVREHEEVLASNYLPQTVDQFDRLLLSSPDSSLIWIQYMAHYLQSTEIEKARIIGKRALKVINFREETEKLNIWQALLNLESKFGSLESLTAVFQEAIKMNDTQKIYEHMLTIYADTDKHSELENIINTMINKFKHHPEMWINCGAALLKIGMKNKSRQIMQNALQSLPKNKRL